MRLKKARVTKYRSIRDSGWFEVEHGKTILVGPNEAGKTALLEALQQLNPPAGVPQFHSLRDYPRSELNDLTTNLVRPENVTVVTGHFILDEEDKKAIPEEFWPCFYVLDRKIDNTTRHDSDGCPPIPTYGALKKDLLRLCAHIDGRLAPPPEGSAPPEPPSAQLATLTKSWDDGLAMAGDPASKLTAWLQKSLPLVEEGNETEEGRHERLTSSVGFAARRDAALQKLRGRLPVFVRFNNYFRVHPILHLEHLAERLEKNLLDDSFYDYGNECLLRLLGFTAKDLSNLGKAPEPAKGDHEAFKRYRDQLDSRQYQLNAASYRLTEQILQVWVPDKTRDEAERLQVIAEGQYLKVVVEDDLGVLIELNQRSEGFQWLVSFFVVFFAEAVDKHKNAILLLDEPGLSLHGLKQREFRATISRLAEKNQTIYTTHSPFLVGPNELDIVRVVEMVDRKVGTKVHTEIKADDPAALLPLQEALGYDLAQSLFTQQRNLVLEGLTDYWYVEAVAQLLRDADVVNLNEKIALVPAGDAGKVVYYATILHAQKLKVAALLDSDTAGDQAAQQDVLVHTLGNKGILRTKDAYDGPVKRPEIEDLLRSTLVEIAKGDLKWDVSATAAAQPGRPIAEIFSAEASGFSKYRLAKAFLRWTRDHQASDLTEDERRQWKKLIEIINSALK